MKLYATVTSERASKGQGGEWLDIDIFTISREKPTHKVKVRENERGEITISLMRQHFGKWYESKGIDTIYTNQTKGEKQKGDTKNPPVSYHEGAKYIDCALEGRGHCNKCGRGN